MCTVGIRKCHKTINSSKILHWPSGSMSLLGFLGERCTKSFLQSLATKHTTRVAAAVSSRLGDNFLNSRGKCLACYATLQTFGHCCLLSIAFHMGSLNSCSSSRVMIFGQFEVEGGKSERELLR